MLTNDQTYEENFEDNTAIQQNLIYANASIGALNSRSIVTLDRLHSHDISFDGLIRNNGKKSEVSF